MIDQTRLFEEAEGDAWYRRNSNALDVCRDDPILAEFARLDDVNSVCEIGCANGWRLAALRGRYPGLERVAGCDVSAEAIKAGREQFPGLELSVGAVDPPPVAGTFDVVIASFVLHWLDRGRLIGSMAGIDALLKPGAVLLIADFLPDRPTARSYHHRRDVEILTYKQDYPAAFTATQVYAELRRRIFRHADPSVVVDVPENDRAVCAVLRKQHNEGYQRQ